MKTSRKLIPYSQLRPWDNNPRQKVDETALEQMESSLREDGVLQNLVVVPQGEHYVVIAGGRRLAALGRLIAKGEIEADVMVPCEVREIDLDDAEAIRIALAENTVREPMDVIDECHAFAEMALCGMTTKSIAAAFGYAERTVKQRIALGRLPDAAKALIRDGARDLDWGQALTAADKASLNKIMSDIADSPIAWQTGAEIRRFLTQDTIPTEFALFDPALYKGPLLRDMFDGDRFQDRAEFWELQNQAIEAKRQALLAEGWKDVVISHAGVDSWRYGQTDNKAEGIVILEVAPTGRVIVHEGLVPTAEAASPAGGVIEAEDEDDEETAGAEAGAPKMPAAVLDFIRSQRSAVLQTGLMASPRKAMEVVVAGLLGHSESPFRVLPYKFRGDPKARQGAAFEAVNKNRAFVQEETARWSASPADLVAHLAEMPEDELHGLFARLVADRFGVSASPVHAEANSLVNQMGRAIGGDMRRYWSPSHAFFEALPTAELRRLALTLLPKERQRGLLAARKKHLVQALMSAFEDAAANLPTMDKASIERLNAWVPEELGFAAPDAKAEDVEDDFLASFASEDAEAA